MAELSLLMGGNPMKLKRMTAALLLLAMLLSCLPLSVLAADAEPVEAEETVDTVPAETADEEVTTEEPVEEAAISTQAVNASGYFYFPLKRQISCSSRQRGSPLRTARPSGRRCTQANIALRRATAAALLQRSRVSTATIPMAVRRRVLRLTALPIR